MSDARRQNLKKHAARGAEVGHHLGGLYPPTVTKPTKGGRGG